jgi:hypothetical protein
MTDFGDNHAALVIKKVGVKEMGLDQRRTDIQNVFRLDDQAPPRPDCACGGEGKVLSH